MMRVDFLPVLLISQRCRSPLTLSLHRDEVILYQVNGLLERESHRTGGCVVWEEGFIRGIISRTGFNKARFICPQLHRNYTESHAEFR